MIINLCCPCEKKSKLNKFEDGYVCGNKDCLHSNSANAFPVINGIPLIISETQTDTVCSLEHGKKYVERSFSELSTLKKLIVGESKTTKTNCKSFVDLMFKSEEAKLMNCVKGIESGKYDVVLFYNSNPVYSYPTSKRGFSSK